MERAIAAIGDRSIAGFDLVELALSPQVFAALRKYLKLGDEQVAMYDLFPLSAALKEELRSVAGQFLAAEALWTLDEQGLLGGVPVHVSLNLPKGWDKDPKKVHSRLIEEGALELSHEGIETFKLVKRAWDQLVS